MKTIEWFKPQGFKTINNSYGIEIMIDDVYEEISYRYSNEGESAVVHQSEIICDQDGDPYFREVINAFQSRVHYLNEFIKINSYE